LKKKKQKNFDELRAVLLTAPLPRRHKFLPICDMGRKGDNAPLQFNKSFLLLFFKKEVLA